MDPYNTASRIPATDVVEFTLVDDHTVTQIELAVLRNKFAEE